MYVVLIRRKDGTVRGEDGDTRRTVGIGVRFSWIHATTGEPYWKQ
jgi:hypothetical protein